MIISTDCPASDGGECIIEDKRKNGTHRFPCHVVIIAIWLKVNEFHH